MCDLGAGDALAGRMEGVTTAAWADAQVDQRRERSMAELLREWSTVAPLLEASADERFPSRLQTILGAGRHRPRARRPGGAGPARRPGRRGAAAGPAFLVREGLHRQLARADQGPVEIRTPAPTWIVGRDAEAGAGATLDMSHFELFRALTGRRSTAQIARLGWSCDPTPYLAAFEFGTFTTRPADLVE